MSRIGKLGVWSRTNSMTAPESAAFARRLEDWGYAALWIPEGPGGRNPLVHAAWLLANTTRLIVATGIANIYARDALATASGQQTLHEQSGGRFLLGLGVSHKPLVEGARGHAYGKPVPTMRAYLDAMSRAKYDAPTPQPAPLTVLAALGPQMLALARERADGAHPYFVPVAHTASARAALGPGKLLCVEQMVLLESNPARAREIARKTTASYLAMDNYRNNLLRLGYSDADVAGGGSDRLVDDIIAWGDERAIRARVQAHWDAGADHVCIQTLNPQAAGQSREALLEMLAPAKG